MIAARAGLRTRNSSPARPLAFLALVTHDVPPVPADRAGRTEQGRHGRLVQLSTICFIVSTWLRVAVGLIRRLSAVSIALRNGVSGVLSPLVSTSRFHSIAPLAKLSQPASRLLVDQVLDLAGRSCVEHVVRLSKRRSRGLFVEDPAACSSRAGGWGGCCGRPRTLPTMITFSEPVVLPPSSSLTARPLVYTHAFANA